MERHRSGFSIIGRLAVIVLLSASEILFSTTTTLAQEAYPVNSVPFGMTYGDWEVAYFQYVFSIPASSNPMLDPSGAACNIAQPSGPVFFLNLIPDHAFFPAWFAGSYAIRTCTIPSRALSIPIAGWLCSNLELPAPEFTPHGLRKCAATAVDGIDIRSLELIVDGKSLSGLIRERRVQSPYFEFRMPAFDSVLPWTDAMSGSAVSDGYFVLLKPLSPGKHVIQFGGAYLSGISPGGLAGDFSVMYNLTVQ